MVYMRQYCIKLNDVFGSAETVQPTEAEKVPEKKIEAVPTDPIHANIAATTAISDTVTKPKQAEIGASQGLVLDTL